MLQSCSLCCDTQTALICLSPAETREYNHPATLNVCSQFFFSMPMKVTYIMYIKLHIYLIYMKHKWKRMMSSKRWYTRSINIDIISMNKSMLEKHQRKVADILKWWACPIFIKQLFISQAKSLNTFTRRYTVWHQSACLNQAPVWTWGLRTPSTPCGRCVSPPRPMSTLRSPSWRRCGTTTWSWCRTSWRTWARWPTAARRPTSWRASSRSPTSRWGASRRTRRPSLIPAVTG